MIIITITIIKMKSEELSEKTNEPYAKSASLLASKIFFHMQSYEDALHHALSAGEQFQIDEHSEYVQKLTEQCIDSYRSYAQAQYAFDKGVATTEPTKIDQRLIEIVERMLNYCYQVGDSKQALGIALELRRMDHILKAIDSSSYPFL
ncbi:26S proteasome non-ATPase regulatory subunit [Reticulomyxa filosa]|uniref:26S proteasome non-ATPase regulatory subunit n=1 Tax=Reticulomyxa filosa TaxID=46433 RepID=X6MLE9_RETFI|nr:26S proteasome non-ATPase regulatory subunit [Reticulomyxa filosa]|eukprot:ETO14714.1 26S proteasome non-ATPase regulatory subunit [Reticulomyxa filosa]